MIILDTNVISELMRPRPDPTALTWSFRQPRNRVFTTAVSEGELRYGLAKLPAGARREELRRAADRTFGDLIQGRILPFDSEAAQCFAAVMAKRRSAGRKISFADAQIAGIALSRNAVIATRDQGDFADCGIELIDPWRPQ